MKLIKSLVFSGLFLSVIFIAGCNEEPTVTNQSNTNEHLSKIELPAGATFDKAELHIFMNYGNGPDPRNVDIYEILEDWDETTVNTVNAPDYDELNSYGSFYTDGAAVWKVVDISDLVEKWLNCEPNYGLLLDQRELTPDNSIAQYSSKEGANPEFLRVFYTLNGVQYSTDEIAIADSYIWCGNSSNGGKIFLETGYVNGCEKQSLIKFDIECTPVYVCETAYAYGGSIATCFLNLSPINANNWGWTNLITPGYTGSWPMYAGAGQCDITKGTLVGTLHVSYVGGTLTIDYDLNSGFVLDETHVWVGNTPLPVKKGKYQTAPGQFNYNGEDPVIITGLTGNKYIAAHSGVCWQVTP